jgi:hypothetical protein
VRTVKKLLLVLLTVTASTTLGVAALTVFAGPLEDYIGVVGGGSQPIGPTFTVDIDVFTDEQNFCAYQHVLQFDPSTVQVDSVTLQESGNFFYFCNSMIDNVAGTVTSTCARLGCGPGAFDGTDQVEMHCIAAGSSSLALVRADTKMRDSSNQPIPISWYDGSVTCQEPPTPTPTPPSGPVGGSVDLERESPALSDRASGAPAIPYAATAGGLAAATLALAAGACYARRRRIR